MRLLLILAVLMVLAGCSNLDRVAGAVSAYCSGTSESEKVVMRERLDQRTAPHRVRIECAGTAQ